MNPLFSHSKIGQIMIIIILNTSVSMQADCWQKSECDLLTDAECSGSKCVAISSTPCAQATKIAPDCKYKICTCTNWYNFRTNTFSRDQKGEKKIEPVESISHSGQTSLVCGDCSHAIEEHIIRTPTNGCLCKHNPDDDLCQEKSSSRRTRKTKR